MAEKKTVLSKTITAPLYIELHFVKWLNRHKGIFYSNLRNALRSKKEFSKAIPENPMTNHVNPTIRKSINMVNAPASARTTRSRRV